jgi:N,N'-diacetyllegionaminate synthase
LDYLCSAFDLASLKQLSENFDMPYFKIASGEILSVDMLEYIADQKTDVLLSTGMASLDEIDTALTYLDRNGRKNVTILHCVSNYPAPHKHMNLRVIESLKKHFGRPVGFSDHSIGPECCLGAVALGASVIEKHVTLDRDQPGPDHKASATISEFSELVTSIRRLEEAMGSSGKKISPPEEAIRNMARKSVVTARQIEKGEIFSSDSICFKRPGTGFRPIDQNKVIGRKAARFLDADRVIKKTDLI